MVNEATTIVTTVKASCSETTTATAVSRKFHNDEGSNNRAIMGTSEAWCSLLAAYHGVEAGHDDSCEISAL
ncbi:hypothetical protein PF011_g24624 [Phytophthora fragariae]|uniref:Uncharacterized protein n=1 Tax=Phytophthora fragariae TaxID=53985 RepID=A0A6A3I4E1_9STRA|nr:hypothetical protein PF011_g24624 [Phytophthora fragariae]